MQILKLLAVRFQILKNEEWWRGLPFQQKLSSQAKLKHTHPSLNALGTAGYRAFRVAQH